MRTEGIYQAGAYIIIGLFILISISSIIIIAEDNDTTSDSIYQGTRTNGDLYDVKVYFRRGYHLSTIYNETGFRTEGLSDNESIEFDLDPALAGDLTVEGRDVGSSKLGFWIFLSILNPPGNTNADLTFEIKEDVKIIAKNTNPISLSGGDTAPSPIMIPYLDESKPSHTFKSGSKIWVTITASVDGLFPVGLTYDNGKNNGYLFFSCDQTKEEEVGGFHSDGSGGEFYPNLPHSDQRKIVFKGSVKDSFGWEDINGVEISLDKGQNNVMPQTAATYTGSGALGYFELEYEYELGLSPGDYLITAYIMDYSDNEHKTTAQLTMSEYGVYLECSNNSAYEYPGDIAKFRITVYNVGGNSDSIRLEPTPDPSNWQTSFENGDTTAPMNPGSSAVKTLGVTVPESALKNDKCIVDVLGKSNNDNSEKYLLTPSISVIALAQFNFKFELLSDSIQTIEASETADYNLRLSNVGSDTDEYTVIAESQELASSDWNAILTTTNPNAVKISNLEYKVELEETKIAEFTLSVTAPDDTEPPLTELEMDISATSKNMTGTGKTIKHLTTTKIKPSGPPPGNVKLSAVTKIKIADPGATIERDATISIVFDIAAENEDKNFDYYVELSIKSMPSTWIYLVNPTDFTVSANDEKDISLTIDIPETDAAGSYAFDLDAEYTLENGDGDSNGIQETSIDLSVTIPEVYDALLEAKETEKNVKNGESVEYLVSITNLGNVKDVDISITATDISNWEVKLSKTSITFEEFGTITDITITVKPLSEASKDEKGIVDIQLEVEDTGEEIGNKITLKTTLEKDTGKEVANFLFEYWFLLVMVIIIIILTFVIRQRMK